ncbi:MAG: hypothetical protein DMG32_21835, partial [Acidobacteria bacterium]
IRTEFSVITGWSGEAIMVQGYMPVFARDEGPGQIRTRKKRVSDNARHNTFYLTPAEGTRTRHNPKATTDA